VDNRVSAHRLALTTASVEMKWLNGWSAAATFEGEFSNVTRSYADKGVCGILGENRRLPKLAPQTGIPKRAPWLKERAARWRLARNAVTRRSVFYGARFKCGCADHAKVFISVYAAQAGFSLAHFVS
jgi:hypothetical protein